MTGEEWLIANGYFMKDGHDRTWSHPVLPHVAWCPDGGRMSEKTGKWAAKYGFGYTAHFDSPRDAVLRALVLLVKDSGNELDYIHREITHLCGLIMKLEGEQ